MQSPNTLQFLLRGPEGSFFDQVAQAEAAQQQHLEALQAANAEHEAKLRERIEALQRKPAQVVLRCLRLEIELEPEKLLGAIADAIAAQLASNSAGHGSASAALDTFRAEARSYLASLRTKMHCDSDSVSCAKRRGGPPAADA